LFAREDAFNEHENELAKGCGACWKWPKQKLEKAGWKNFETVINQESRN